MYVLVLQIEQYSFVDAERDYTTLCKRYSKLYVVPEFAKVSSPYFLLISCLHFVGENRLLGRTEIPEYKVLFTLFRFIFNL